MSWMDMNQNGRVDSKDFSQAGKMAYGTKGAILGAVAFKVLDRNGDGQLNGSEAFGLFANYGQQGLQQQHMQYQQMPQQHQYAQMPQQHQYAQMQYPQSSSQQYQNYGGYNNGY
jgi:hypothetical protein